MSDNDYPIKSRRLQDLESEAEAEELLESEAMQPYMSVLRRQSSSGMHENNEQRRADLRAMLWYGG